MTWPSRRRSKARDNTARTVRSVEGEPGVFDLSLEDKDLMAKGENLCVTLVTGHEQQSETSDQQPEQV